MLAGTGWQKREEKSENKLEDRKKAQLLPTSTVGCAHALPVDRRLGGVGGLRTLLGIHLPVRFVGRHRHRCGVHAALHRRHEALLPVCMPLGNIVQGKPDEAVC